MDKANSEDFFDAGNGEGYDVVVVGSGYGGSVAACRMSTAGFKVCLLEKGRQWEAKDFPTDSFKMCSAVRVENKHMRVNFGPRDALFQVHLQDDALAVTACGLGGGSLVNAGVILPPTVRARRNPKWPKAWEKDWDRYEAAASDMLRAQNVPTKFQNSNVMEGVIGEENESKLIPEPIKLSMNFDMEEQVSDSKRSQESASCLACGNCLAGCPYNAKNSTDKTYLASAISAGCTIKTECEVQYVVRNLSDTCKQQGKLKRSRRKWLVFLNEFDHIAADIVILSAGVFGTTKILFQSELRGLQVSQKLGSGFSCNGNNVAYLAGSPAPLNAFGLNRNQVSAIPFHERPGPSISSSYSSSLGFTIQSAVIPTAYPSFLFKGGTTYKSHSNNYSWFGYVLLNWLKHMLNLNPSQEMVLNAIGHDDNNGKLTFDRETNRILFQPPKDHLLPRKVEAFQKLAKKLSGVLFMARYRSSSVHLLGGCNASSDVSSGVCNPDGQVFDTKSPTGVHPGLYVCDASLIPCSIGINPILTIAAVAEHVSRCLVQESANYSGNFLNRKFDPEPGSISKYKTGKRSNSYVMTKEVMRGQVGGMLCTAHLNLRFETSCDVDKTNVAIGKSFPPLCGQVGGYIECNALEVGKMYIIHGEVDLCKTDIRTPYTQYMNYHLLLATSSGARYILEGRKMMNPYLLGLYAWRESTTLHVTLRKVPNNKLGEDEMDLSGKLHISPLELLKSVCALEGQGRIKFVLLLLQSIFRTYIHQAPRGSHIDFSKMELPREPYPSSTVYEIQTEDNFIIHLEHWESSNGHQEHIQGKKLYPVLLINGYATESYYLPTERNDFIRTLLKDGRDVWLLHSRVHWSNPSNKFTIEDIGRMDIPAAINKIIEFYQGSKKIHVVAHCIGGCAIHISLMGGHVSAKHIASLSCSNSSMYFKLTAYSSFKMWLPLVLVSMVIMGENKILPMLQTSTLTFRHRVLKYIAHLIPRYERCTCDECEVFSGIFGNAFWHENISPTMHYWMNKENLTQLPMAAFPHLRKICKAGFIVDSEGDNAYLIHPERMALPTLYISGGRTLLVTPETSFLANKYMKLHQPHYRHERVVIDGFGHSDLWIGEKSSEKVFPHIQRYLDLVEEETSRFKTEGGNNYMNYALAWSADPYENVVSFEGWIIPLLIIFILLVVLFRLFFF